MAKLNRKQIQDLARDRLEGAPRGVRWSELLKAIHADHPETPINSIQGATLALLNIDPGVVKVARGVYQLAKYQDADAGAAAA